MFFREGSTVEMNRKARPGNGGGELGLGGVDECSTFTVDDPSLLPTRSKVIGSSRGTDFEALSQSLRDTAKVDVWASASGRGSWNRTPNL